MCHKRIFFRALSKTIELKMAQRYSSGIRLLLFSATLLTVFYVNSSFAKSSNIDDSALETKVEKLLEELRSQKQSLEAKEKELQEQKELLDQKMSMLDQTLGEAENLLGKYRGLESTTDENKFIGEKGLSLIRGRGTEEVGVERKTQSQKAPEVPAVAVDEGGVLLPKGRLVIEPSLQYSRSSALRVAVEGYTVIPAINVGLFDISEIDRDVFTMALTGRIGVTDRLELEAYIPYLWRKDSTVGRPIGVGTATDILNIVDGSGLGDIELAGHYQINNGKNGWPFFIGNMRFKSITGEGPFDVPTDPNTGLQLETPTGSGFYSLQPSVTMLYPSDPAVFFSNLGYTYNMERDVGGGNGDIDPGDSVNASFGMGFSINDRTSFSLGYSHSAVFKTKHNGSVLTNSQSLQVGTTNVGYSYQLNDRVGVNLNIATGVTDDAPDMQATLRVPVKFSLY